MQDNEIDDLPSDIMIINLLHFLFSVLSVSLWLIIWIDCIYAG